MPPPPGVGSVRGAGLATLGLAVLVLLGTAMPAGGARAQQERSGDWEPTALTGSMERLFTPASGALLARTPDGLVRSDDGGVTWTALTLPAAGGGARLVEVDPADQSQVYATGSEGLYKSSDGGATWRLTRPGAGRTVGLAVSPALPALVYLAEYGDYRMTLLRSPDGGASWETAWTRQGDWSRCSVFLAPHPTDARRVFRSTPCGGGSGFSGADLETSADQGATWQSVLKMNSEGLFVERLVGGQGTAPRRFYLSIRHNWFVGGSAFFRSDDDGATWSEILGFRGGGSQRDSDGTDVRIGGLAYASWEPDRVFLGLDNYRGPVYAPNLTGSRVSASADGGSAWTDLGRQALGRIQDLALGIDGRNLYAAADRGLWRLRLER